MFRHYTYDILLPVAELQHLFMNQFCVLSQLYTKTREKVFFNFILKQHWIPIAVW